MFKFFRLKVFVAIMALLSVAAFVTVAYANHSWSGYHWARTANPFTLKLGDNVTSAWDTYLGTTSGDWSVSNVLDTTIVAGQAKGNCGAVTGTVQVCNKNYGFNGWLGVAQIWVTSDLHILKGTTKLNDSYFNTSSYNNPAWKQFVMCQEVGHTLGLGHNDENFGNPNKGTCMDYTNDPARNDGLGDNLHPNQHDYDELAIIYSHLDSFTSAFSGILNGKSSVTAPDDAGTSNPSEWGKAIRKSSDGRNSLYERDLGRGNKLFTFVIWAD